MFQEKYSNKVSNIIRRKRIFESQDFHCVEHQPSGLIFHMYDVKDKFNKFCYLCDLVIRLDASIFTIL